MGRVGSSLSCFLMAAKLCLKDTPEVRDLTRARIPLYDINKSYRRVTVAPNSKQFHAKKKTSYMKGYMRGFLETVLAKISGPIPPSLDRASCTSRARPRT
jgi:hypothetical protein